MIVSNTTQKILHIHKKRKMYQQAQEWLQPGQRHKQNLNRGNPLAWQLFPLSESMDSKISTRKISRRKSSIIIHKYKFGPMIDG